MERKFLGIVLYLAKRCFRMLRDGHHPTIYALAALFKRLGIEMTVEDQKGGLHYRATSIWDSISTRDIHLGYRHPTVRSIFISRILWHFL